MRASMGAAARRATGGLVGVTVALALAACAAGESTEATPQGPWVSACTLLTENDLHQLEFAPGVNLKIITLNKKETNDSVGNARRSECRYAGTAVRALPVGGTTGPTGDFWVTVTVRERGASAVFPPDPSYPRLDLGLGDEAFWAGANSPVLQVRKGETLYTFESSTTVDNANPQIFTLLAARFVMGHAT